MSQPQDHVTEATYFEFPVDCAAFLDQLADMHAILQKKATNDTSGTTMRFDSELWWYHIYISTPDTFTTNPQPTKQKCEKWHMLHSQAAYQKMITTFHHHQTSSNNAVTLELTNNLKFVHSKGHLPRSAYPVQATISTDTYSNETTAVQIFPVHITINKLFPIAGTTAMSVAAPPQNLHTMPIPIPLPPPARQVISTTTATNSRPPPFPLHRRRNDIPRRYSVPFDKAVIGIEESGL